MGLACDLDCNRCDPSNGLCKVADGQILITSDMVGPGFPVDKEGPEPGCQVGGVEVGTEGCAISLDLDGSPIQGVPDEVAKGEMLVQGEVGTREGKAACDGGFGIPGAARLRKHLLRRPFAQSIGRQGQATVTRQGIDR